MITRKKIKLTGN